LLVRSRIPVHHNKPVENIQKNSKQIKLGTMTRQESNNKILK